MQLLADTHVHYYREYGFQSFFDAAFKNLEWAARGAGLRPDHLKALFLCDRAGQNTLRLLLEERPAGFRINASEEGGAAEVRAGDHALLLAAGRQIVSAEKIEVLGLGVPRELPDGRPVRETIDSIRGAGGVPVLCWSPGKWCLKRGKIVKRVIEEGAPGGFLAGDIALRWRALRMPRLLDAARERGIGLIAGSDPLPFASDCRQVGSYATLVETGEAMELSASSLARSLWTPGILAGRRNGLFDSIKRFTASNLTRLF